MLSVSSLFRQGARGKTNNDDIGSKVSPFKIKVLGSCHHGSVETNLTSIHEYVGLIPGLAQWVKELALL